MKSMYRVETFWDDEAQVWVAESEEIAGLVTEASSLEILTNKLKQLIPEMLELNHHDEQKVQEQIKFELITRRQELIDVA
jgi:predicted RNase H-like HicB family nuclease